MMHNRKTKSKLKSKRMSQSTVFHRHIDTNYNNIRCNHHQSEDANTQVSKTRVQDKESHTRCLVQPLRLFFILCQILIIISYVIVDFNQITSVDAHLLSKASSIQADRRFGFGGAGASVDIALEKVPEKPSDGYSAKKKFPITWLRNQYPFNKKKKSKYPQVNQYHQQQEQLYGQYSNQQFDVLDPNPSTWIKLTPPDNNKPVISKQLLSPPQVPMFIQTPQVPPSIAFQQSQLLMHPSQQQHIANIVRQLPSVSPVNINKDVMQFSSSDQIIQQHYNSQGPAAAGRLPYRSPSDGRMREAPRQGRGADSSKSEGGDGYGSGFGGFSFDFGNGRTISIGGGKGVTIGTKAGAISIGGKGGGSEGGGDTGEPLSSQGSHSDGYSSGEGRTISIGGGKGISFGGGGSSYESSSGGSSYGGNDKYYKKNYKPTMSIEMPKKGKTVIHADLDMAPIKVKLRSSPRVKITTGSRDPLEKPSDEELEPEEDIFEPPEPFMKVNSTTSGNDTSLANSTSADNSTATGGNTTTNLVNGTSHLFGGGGGGGGGNGQFVVDDYYSSQRHYPPPAVGQQLSGYQQAQNHFYDPHQRQLPLYHHQQQHHDHANNQFHSGSPPPLGGPPLKLPYHTQPFDQQQQQHHQQLPLDPGYFAGPNHPASGTHQHWQEQVDNLNNHHHGDAVLTPQNHANQMGDQPATNQQAHLPALNQWRQFSKEAKNNLPRPDHHDSAIDANHDRFYAHSDMQQPPIRPQPEQMISSTTPNSNSNLGAHFDDHPSEAPIRSGHQYAPRQPVWGPIVELPNSSFDNSSSGSRQQNAHLANTRYHIGSGPVFDADYSSSDNVKSYASLKPMASQQYPQVSRPGPSLQRSQQQIYETTSQYYDVSHQHHQQPNDAYHGGQYQQQHIERGNHYPAVVQQQYDNGQHHIANYDHSSLGPTTNSKYNEYSAQHLQQDAPGKSYHQADSHGKHGTNSGASSYGSSSGSGYGSGYGSGHGGDYGDGYNKNDYATKVEKYEPGAHDKRERSKVILFLKPRISIHQANSSTTTKRPKNRQRFLHVINTPVFLNNTGNHTYDDNWMDPDLKDTYGYGHGGYGYGKDYSKSSSTTTKKPRPKTTTTTTTTTTSPDNESTTTSTDGTSTTSDATTTSTSGDSTTTDSGSSGSSTTEPTTTSTEGDSSSTTTDGSASSASTIEREGEPSSSTESSGSSTTTSTEKEEPSSTTSATTSTSESSRSKPDTTTEETEEEDNDEAKPATTTTTTTTTASSIPKKKKKAKQATTTTSTSTTSSTTELPLPPLDDEEPDTMEVASTTTQATNDQSSVVDIFASTSSPVAVTLSTTGESIATNDFSDISPTTTVTTPEEEAPTSSTTSMAPSPATMTKRAMASKPPPPQSDTQQQQTIQKESQVAKVQAVTSAKQQVQQTKQQVKKVQMAVPRKPSTTTSTSTTTTTTTTTTELPPTTVATTLTPIESTTLAEIPSTISSLSDETDPDTLTQVSNFPDFPLAPVVSSNSALFRDLMSNVDAGNSMNDKNKFASEILSGDSNKAVEMAANSNLQSIPNVVADSQGGGDIAKSLVESTIELITSTQQPSSEVVNEPLESTTTPVSVVLPSGSEIVSTTSANTQQPMLLNEELIEKLMRNKTLINMMSNQLTKVMNINGDKTFNNDDKMALVRMVFDQMMEKKVDFSSNNVRLAVKTVSSSYKEALKKSSVSLSSGPIAFTNPNEKTKSVRSSRSKPGSFGQRVNTDDSYSEASSNIKSTRSSKSIRAINTALKLTGSGNRKIGSSSHGNHDNPIVVVLLPQEKAR